MSRCRSCRVPKWRNDLCANAACPKRAAAPLRMRPMGKPITVAVKHGFHAEYVMRRAF